ncbi:hypothetical protein GCM10008934_05390 [Virgibacillus salarius]
MKIYALSAGTVSANSINKNTLPRELRTRAVPAGVKLFINKKNGAKFAQSLSLNAQIYASSSSYYGIIATA